MTWPTALGWALLLIAWAGGGLVVWALVYAYAEGTRRERPDPPDRRV